METEMMTSWAKGTALVKAPGLKSQQHLTEKVLNFGHFTEYL